MSPPPTPLSGVALHDPPAGVDYTQVMVLPESATPDSGMGFRAIAGIIMVFLGYLVGSQLLLYLGSTASWLARGRATGFQDAYRLVVGYHVPEGIAIVDLALACPIVIVLFVARVWNGIAARWVISVRPGMRWVQLSICLVIGFVVLNGIYLMARGDTPWQSAPPPNAWVWIVLVVLTAPLQAAGEEFLFRGYLQQALGALTGRWWIAVVVSALVFAAMHGTQNLALFADRFGFGLAAGLMVVLTGGLEASIAMHAANNVSTFSYAVIGGTLVQTRAIDQSSWTTTGVNVLSYALAGALAVLVARLLGLRRRTPKPSV